MAERVPARLTVREGRRFGLTVGSAFLAITAALWWRGHGLAAAATGAAGAALALAGLVIPTSLGPVERTWMRLARAISRVTTPIVMAAMYLLVLTPVGLARRTFGGNPLVHPPTDGGFWKRRPEGRRRTGSMERQF